MAKIEITIKGIAMSYHKNDDIWKFIFPFADKPEEDCHDVRFTVGSGRTIPLAQAGRRVVIKTEGASSEFGIGDGYEDFLDLTTDYSHQDGILKLSDWTRQSVFLSIENAVFSLLEYTHSKYSLELGGRTTKPSDHIGYSGVATIEAKRVIIEISDGDTITLTEDTKVIFDNTCEEKIDRNNADFQMLYQAVKDKNDAAKQFTLKRDPLSLPKLPVNTFVLFNNNPRSGEPGLPCNKVRVSNPGDLP